MTSRRLLLTGTLGAAAAAAGIGIGWWHRRAEANDPLAAMWDMRFERPEGGELGDQKRVVTPRQAVDDGASILVIGRPITGAPNPARAMAEIAATLTDTVRT